MNTGGFNDLLLSNADFLRPFAINLTKDSDSANDLFQETLYKALVNREKYHSGTNIRAWLYTIMRNIFINNYRRNARQKTIFDNTPGDFLINLRQASVPNQAEANIHIKEIRLAIEHLPEIFKNPFQLYFDGYKYQEIAEILHEPLGTIKSRIHFARKLLKEQIARG
ncbi:MAG: RNA polymerase sigma factor [Bacteroidetes bacterium]|nr:RNA polymerase sigma factor [Bacteroidota bacterium]MBS1930846.1 RNA polymerase sigma factor [Bacteroidota bacterium]